MKEFVMNHDPDKEMQEVMEEIAEDLGYPSKTGENIRRPRRSSESNLSRKLLVFGVIAILVLIILIQFFFRSGSEVSKRELSAIQAKVDELEQRSVFIDKMKERISDLEKQDKERQQAVEEAQRSDRLILERVDKLSEGFQSVEKTLAALGTKKAISPPAASQKKAPSQATQAYYEVRPGDNLYQISKKYGITVEELRRLNKLSVNQALHPGQKIVVSPASQ
jgi:LysM repeat protein